MRYQKFLFLIPVLLLSSCGAPKPETSRGNIDIPIVEIERDYSEIKEFQITWDNIFNINSDDYFVYFYSLNCDHCVEMKNYIINKALEVGNIYFVKSSSKVRLSENIFDTMGVNDIEDLSILGFPSCLEIKEHICIKNVAGKTQIIQILN